MTSLSLSFRKKALRTVSFASSHRYTLFIPGILVMTGVIGYIYNEARLDRQQASVTSPAEAEEENRQITQTAERAMAISDRLLTFEAFGKSVPPGGTVHIGKSKLRQEDAAEHALGLRKDAAQAANEAAVRLITAKSVTYERYDHLAPRMHEASYSGVFLPTTHDYLFTCQKKAWGQNQTDIESTARAIGSCMKDKSLKIREAVGPFGMAGAGLLGMACFLYVILFFGKRWITPYVDRKIAEADQHSEETVEKTVNAPAENTDPVTLKANTAVPHRLTVKKTDKEHKP